MLIKPTNTPGFTDNLLQEASCIVKYFEPGDQVRAIDGKFKGETGIVVSSETNEKGVSFAHVVLSLSNKEIKILSNNLKLKSEIE